MIGSIASIIGLTFFLTCDGDGIGLDEFGDLINPSDSSNTNGGNSIPLEPTLESIQANIFNAVCAVKCHKGSRAKKGLRLEEGESYQHLVNVDSKEKPNMKRVLPFFSENSYIIWKLEGRSGISGKQMPLNLNPLPKEQIDAIRDWIDLGAPE